MPAKKARHQSVMSADLEALAGIYAQSLLDYLPQSDRAADSAEELEHLVETLNEHDRIDDLLTLPLGVNDRCALVERLFQDRLSEPTYALLAVMARRGRMALLRAVSRAYRRLLDARGGKIEVTVTTASHLTTEQRDQLLVDLEHTFQAKPILTERVDPAIIGGIIIKKGDLVVDNSVRTVLTRTVEAVMEQSKNKAGQTG